jgi:hypothetical protein
MGLAPLLRVQKKAFLSQWRKTSKQRRLASGEQFPEHFEAALRKGKGSASKAQCFSAKPQ